MTTVEDHRRAIMDRGKVKIAGMLQELRAEGSLIDRVASDAGRDLLSALTEQMRMTVKYARDEFYRKPAITLPFGASLPHATTIARNHPELREINLARGEESPTAVYDATRMLQVRRTLLNQFRVTNEEVGLDPDSTVVFTSGVSLKDHGFFRKMPVPVRTLENADFTGITIARIIVDYHYSTYSFRELKTILTQFDNAEMTIVVPYDRTMWNFTAGNLIQAGYAFRWMLDDQMAMTDTPRTLPSDFFHNSEYDDHYIFIQPYGSNKALRISKLVFLEIFKGPNLGSVFNEIRQMRNGFADVSFIHSKEYERVGLRPETYTVEELSDMALAVPVGKRYVRRTTRFLERGKDIGTLFGHQFDVETIRPLFVEESYWRRASNFLNQMSFSRDVPTHLLRHLFAYSQFLTYNGAVVTVDQMIDVEDMCVIAETLIAEKIPQKIKFRQLSDVTSLSTAADPSTLLSRASSVSMSMLGQEIKPSRLERLTGLSFFKRDRRPIATEDPSPAIEVTVRGEPRVPGKEKADAYSTIVTRAEELLPVGGAILHFDRSEISVEKDMVIDARRLLKSFEQSSITIPQVQAIYDSIFPPNSLIDPTVVQLMVEKEDHSFFIDTTVFKVSVPTLFTPFHSVRAYPSLLRTSVAADLFSSSRSMLGALMKRTFNRTPLEEPSQRDRYSNETIERVLATFGSADAAALRKIYSASPVTVSSDLIGYWANNHTTDEVVSAATMLNRDPAFESFSTIPKSQTKPKMSVEAAGSVGVGQVVIFHTKDKIALTVGLFVVILERLMALFPLDFRLAFGADEHSAGAWADRHLGHADRFVYEIDMPKFDKSQHWQCMSIVLAVMHLVGVESQVVEIWRRANQKGYVHSNALLMTFVMMFGNRSGVGGTIAINCIVLLFAFLDTFADMGITGLLIKGDDSVLVTKRPLTSQHEANLASKWGLTMKVINQDRRYKQFCSGFFVKDKEGNHALVRDPVRVLEKMGRWLPMDKPSEYFLDYYASMADTALQYSDGILVENLRAAVSEAYQLPSLDMQTMIQFIQQVSCSPQRFLVDLYGLSKDKIRALQDLDVAAEVLLRRKSLGFAKARTLGEIHPEVRRSLTQKAILAMGAEFDRAGQPRSSRNELYGMRRVFSSEHVPVIKELETLGPSDDVVQRYQEFKNWQDHSQYMI